MQRVRLITALSTFACASFAWAASTAKATENKSDPAQHAPVTRWHAQELKGTVSMVDSKQDLLVVRDASGVPFDFRIQRSTHIANGQTPVKLSELAKNQSVDVRFIPEARGDIARQVEIQH